MRKTLYNWGEVPQCLALTTGDRIRFNKRRNFYTVVEIHNGWAIAQKKTRKGYGFAILSVESFPETEDMFQHTYHIVRVYNARFDGELKHALLKYLPKMQKHIDEFNARTKAFRLPQDCVLDCEIRRNSNATQEG